MKCPHCPIAAGKPCMAETPGWSFLCGMAERGNAVELAHIVAKSKAGTTPAPVEYPPPSEQAGNLAKSVVSFVQSGFATVDRAEFERRRTICAACPLFDAARQRCRACGCRTRMKLWGAMERCPHPDGPKW